MNGTQLAGEENVLEFPNLGTDYIIPQRKFSLFGALALFSTGLYLN